jgi:hypothetical protein
MLNKIYTLQQIAQGEGENVLRQVVRILDINQIFKVLELKDGRVYIETQSVDTDTGITTVEILMGRNRKTFCLIRRYRFGSEYNDMQSFERDSKYPLFCHVKL